MAVTPKIESANGSGRSTAKLPMRARKKGPDFKAPIPIRSGKSGWSKIDGMLEENILTLLCFGDNDSIDKIISTIPTSLYSADDYRIIVDRAIKYYRKYGEAAGDHLPDLFEDLLLPDKPKSKLYVSLLHDLYDLSKNINSEFILDSLQDFVANQVLRQSITYAAEQLKKGNVDATVRALLDGAQRAERQESANLLTPVRSVQDLMDAEIPSLQEIFDPVLQYPAVLLVIGQRGSFKTLLAMSMALAAASGKDLFNWDCNRPCRVLFLDFEMQVTVGKQRFKMLQKSLGLKPEPEMLNIWYAADSQPKPVPNLCDREQTSALIDQCCKYDLVFLDNISAAARGADLNKIEEIEPIREFATGLQHRDTSCVLVHHLGKDPSRGARGSSGLEDVPDTILKLTALESPAGSSLIKVSQTKSRHHAPSEFGPINLCIDSAETGLSIKHKTIRESKSDLVKTEYLRLLEDGLIRKGTQASLAKQFDVNPSTVSKAALKVSRKFKGKEKS